MAVPAGPILHLQNADDLTYLSCLFPCRSAAWNLCEAYKNSVRTSQKTMTTYIINKKLLMLLWEIIGVFVLDTHMHCAAQWRVLTAAAGVANSLQPPSPKGKRSFPQVDCERQYVQSARQHDEECVDGLGRACRLFQLHQSVHSLFKFYKAGFTLLFIF